MKVVYTARARMELEEIGDYISEESPTGAKRVRDAIRRSIALVAAFPRRGRKQKAHGVRRVGAGKYPYHVYYHFDDDAQIVTILSIYHAARRQKHEST